MFCGQCGSKMNDDAAFCGNCGAKIAGVEKSVVVAASGTGEQSQQAQKTTNTDTSIQDEELLQIAYITGLENGNTGSSSCQHYLSAFKKFASTGSYINWNWAAFLTTFINLAYRKNYVVALVLYIVTLIANSIQPLVGILLGFCFPMFADYICYRRYKEKLAIAKATYPDDFKQQKVFMAHSGGVNNAAIIVGVLLLALLVVILFAVGAFAALAYGYY